MSNATVFVNPLTGQPIGDQELKSLADLAIAQLNLEKKLQSLEEEAATLKERLRNISEIVIPETMTQLGMSAFKLADGCAITIKPFVSAKIPEAEEDHAFAWLRSNNHDSIIKQHMALEFGKGEDKRAQKVAATLVKMGIPFKSKTGVHPMTLKSFCRERIEAGDITFPKELFGVFEGKKSVITPPKQ